MYSRVDFSTEIFGLILRISNFSPLISRYPAYLPSLFPRPTHSSQAIRPNVKRQFVGTFALGLLSLTKASKTDSEVARQRLLECAVAKLRQSFFSVPICPVSNAQYGLALSRLGQTKRGRQADSLLKLAYDRFETSAQKAPNRIVLTYWAEALQSHAGA